MVKFIKSLLIPNEDNKFLPKIIEYRALVLYAFISVAVFAFVYPVFLKTDKLLAYLTQELIVQEVNPIRQEQGFLALKTNEKLTLAAQLKAQDMINRNYFEHIGPNGELPWAWLEKANYNFSAAAENLAIDVSQPKILVDAWLASPSHAKNILNGYFTDIGIGIASGELEGRKTTVVVMFLAKEALQKPVNPIVVLKEENNNVLPQEPISTQVAENDEQGLFQKASVELFLVSELPFQVRFGLTIFFNVIILWALVTFLMTKKRLLARTFNCLIVLAFLFFIWLPEIV